MKYQILFEDCNQIDDTVNRSKAHLNSFNRVAAKKNIRQLLHTRIKKDIDGYEVRKINTKRFFEIPESASVKNNQTCSDPLKLENNSTEKCNFLIFTILEKF